MGNRFDLTAAQQLSETLLKTADTMESETEKIQNDFKLLGDTFKDKAYNEFQSELNAADRSISSIISDIRELQRSIVDYTNQMSDLL